MYDENPQSLMAYEQEQACLAAARVATALLTPARNTPRNSNITEDGEFGGYNFVTSAGLTTLMFPIKFKIRYNA